ncbi:phosphatidate cytidylyltransferase [Natranaerovirga pectinivora]|uniref:Phosphatidate cytidylyltransferase n=1 Tax=Natranaerovirga pectinivora TaxID=682400 RepID=A0A4R3MMJ0_9FIRM|nr:phosphatidate cytidylyltransferase [Natranaerovirga pectinivora]TCT15065.1 phosphatidate cytidylyltransferase [Natranaerovirga pectinivora]
MKIRLLSSIIGFPIALFIVIYGDLLLLTSISIIAFIGLVEIFRAFNVKSMSVKVIGYFTHFIYFIILAYNQNTYMTYLISFYLLCLLILFVLQYPKFEINTILYVFFSFFYVSFLFSHIYLVRNIPEYGIWLVWLIFISAWGSDTFAYATGLTIGKNLLAPELSPKKTKEGAIGGVVGATLLACIFGYFFTVINDLNSVYIVLFAIVAGIASILSQIGDLAASAIKRKVQIKDFGNLIPGHGGILDRFDSIIFTAPFVYYVVTIFIN